MACAFVARRSKKPLSSDVSLVLFALLPPVIGNQIIISSVDWLTTQIGCYLYYLGMDVIVVALLRFTTNYCSVKYEGTAIQKAIIALALIDIIQLASNPITGFAFTTREIMVDGAPYYALVPLAGQVFHRIVAYGIFLGSLGVFIYKCIKTSRIYLERYAVILAIMLFVGLWQSFYIFSGTPIDRSMIGFAVFGLLIFYFAMYFKPYRLLDRMLAQVVSAMGEGVMFFDDDSECIYVNDAAREMLGMDESADPEECLQRVIHIVGEEDFDLGCEWTANRSVGEGDRRRFWSLHYRMSSDEKNRHVGTFLVIHDRTEEEQRIRREKYLATHDPLTGLYNAAHLSSMIRKTIDSAPSGSYFVIMVDVKDFKLVNDVFNRKFGDRVLCWIAQELLRDIPEGAVCGRVQGDRFGICVSAEEFVEDEVAKILSSVEYHDEASDADYPLIMHMGIYRIVDTSLPVSIMLDRAYMALTTIKEDFRQHIAYYDDTMREGAMWRQKISSELDAAIETGQIRPYLQPLVDQDGNYEGAEVLVRWIHPEEGFMAPARFIPVFEDNGMIARLDVHMWECACKILKDWERRGIDLFLSVNISPKDFYFMNVEQAICNLVKLYEIDPGKLRLEITETIMMSDAENRLRIVNSLREAGFLVEMDDFGSGYSSLNMLKDIPVDVLKIDMMFLYETEDAHRAETILSTIIDLSNRLDMPSVTEGVETAEQLAMLVSMGCRMFQGYYFAKPMPVEDFEKVIAA